MEGANERKWSRTGGRTLQTISIFFLSSPFPAVSKTGTVFALLGASHLQPGGSGTQGHSKTTLDCPAFCLKTKPPLLASASHGQGYLVLAHPLGVP